MRAAERTFDLVLTDGKAARVPLGRFQAISIMDAEQKARKAYSGMFKRLKLRDWRVEEVR